jgi:hypothetical protein
LVQILIRVLSQAILYVSVEVKTLGLEKGVFFGGSFDSWLSGEIAVDVT